MAFTPKDWQNTPSAATPISASALEDLETRVTDYADDVAEPIAADVAVIGETVNLDVNNGTDQASALQTALDNIESQGGGRVLLPRTGYSGSGITINSRIDIGHAVNIIGQGKRETKFTCGHSSAGLYFIGSSDPGYTGATNRGGESGGFHIQGNDTATTVLTMRSTNRIIKDIRVSTPANNGTAIYGNGAQNVNWYGIEAEDGSHSPSRTVKGIVFDGAAAGHNFFGTSINEFTAGHIVVDATYDAPSELGVDYCKNLCFYGNMIERTDTGNPIIHIKAGVDIHFDGGNFAGGSESGAFTPAAEYDVVKIDNTAARSYSTIGGAGAPTRAVTFTRCNMWGQLGAGATRYANAFRCAADLAPWQDSLYVDPTCTYTNCNYLARIDSGAVVVQAPNAPNAAGGGLVGWSNPAGAGKINARIMNTASTLDALSTCDYYELSSGTTITSISPTYAGHKITLRFIDNAQVTDGSNLKLAGNFTGSGGRILSLVCDGTDWYETGRVTT